jgi:glyoxylase-like metal-dependent hydrolase (beta-lactamase superfamily II)
LARERQPELVAEGVVRVGTDLVNWFLVETDGRVVVVDGGLPPYRPQLEPGLALLGKGTGDVEAIVLTHGHGDHTGVVEDLRAELGVPVYVHAGDEELATTGGAIGKTETTTLAYLNHVHAWRLLGHFKLSGKPKPVQTVQTFEDGAELPGGLRAIHTGGHTEGHVVLYEERRRLLFVGDLLTTDNPLTGGRGPELLPRALNLSSATMLDSLAKLEHLDVQSMLFGHGDTWTGGAAAAVRRAREIGPT